jgi:2-oxoglutarate ferredoxin oxidoreductase subunit beta
MTTPNVPEYKAKDFQADDPAKPDKKVAIRWCPGCGDYAILSQVQRVMADLGRPKEEFVFVSGIGCSSRFPYYMNTYGFHTIHGRAPSFATAIRTAREDLSVWVITGDGDSLSIGGNHLIHVLRRNVDIQLLLFNNRIYGLTKGQYSPTSAVGTRTKSTPMGSVDRPFNPIQLALGAGSTYVARTVDVFVKHQRELIASCYHHRGASFLEIYQNCNIFNDGAFDQIGGQRIMGMDYTDKRGNVQAVQTLELEHGAPMVFGMDDARKGLRLNGSKWEIFDIGDRFSADDAMVYDETDLGLAQLTATLDYPNHPVPIGVFYRVKAPTYDDEARAQVQLAQERNAGAGIKELLYAGETWTV